MDENKKKVIGKVTIHDEHTKQTIKEIEITDMVRSVFNDHRMCTIARTEDNTFVLAIENPASTGRLPMSQIHLSEDSMLALVNGIFLFYHHNNIDIEQKMKEIVDSDSIIYEYDTTKEGRTMDSKSGKTN